MDLLFAVGIVLVVGSTLLLLHQGDSAPAVSELDSVEADFPSHVILIPSILCGVALSGAALLIKKKRVFPRKKIPKLILLIWAVPDICSTFG